jgi:hypothetical protein
MCRNNNNNDQLWQLGCAQTEKICEISGFRRCVLHALKIGLISSYETSLKSYQLTPRNTPLE